MDGRGSPRHLFYSQQKSLGHRTLCPSRIRPRSTKVCHFLRRRVRFPLNSLNLISHDRTSPGDSILPGLVSTLGLFSTPGLRAPFHIPKEAVRPQESRRREEEPTSQALRSRPVKMGGPL